MTTVLLATFLSAGFAWKSVKCVCCPVSRDKNLTIKNTANVLVSGSVVVSHIIFLRRYVLEGVPDLVTLDHRVGNGRLGRKRGGVSARGFKGLAAAWTEPHTIFYAGCCRRTHFNSSVGQELRIFSQFNTFHGHRCDGDTFGK